MQVINNKNSLTNGDKVVFNGILFNYSGLFTEGREYIIKKVSEKFITLSTDVRTFIIDINYADLKSFIKITSP